MLGSEAIGKTRKSVLGCWCFRRSSQGDLPEKVTLGYKPEGGGGGEACGRLGKGPGVGSTAGAKA